MYGNSWDKFDSHSHSHSPLLSQFIGRANPHSRQVSMSGNDNPGKSYLVSGGKYDAVPNSRRYIISR